MSEYEIFKKTLNAKLTELKGLIFKSLFYFYEKDIKLFEEFSFEIIKFFKNERSLLKEINLIPSLINNLDKLNKSQKKDLITKIFEIIDEFDNKNFKIDYNKVKQLLEYFKLNKTYPNKSELKELGIKPEKVRYYLSLLKEFSNEGEYLFKKDYINNKIKNLILTNEKPLKDRILINDIKNESLKNLNAILNRLKGKNKSDLKELELSHLVIDEGLTFLEALNILEKLKIKPHKLEINDFLEIPEKVQLIDMDDVYSGYNNLLCKNCGSELPNSLLNLLKEREEVICPECGIKIKKKIV